VDEKTIGRAGVAQLVLRSLFLQAAWNYEGLQTLGFAYIMFPVARRLTSGEAVPKEFLARHTALFNTNPILASYIIGAAAKLEEEHEAGLRSAADIEVLKSSLAVPLAAIGDRFFWATLRPFSGVVGILIAGSFGLLGAVTLLVLYNVFHLYYRVKGVIRGYALGATVVGEIPKLGLMRLSQVVGWLGAVALGVLVIGAGYAWTIGWRREALFLFPLIVIATGLLPESFQKRITEIAIAVGAAGAILTAVGVLG